MDLISDRNHISAVHLAEALKRADPVVVRLELSHILIEVRSVASIAGGKHHGAGRISWIRDFTGTKDLVELEAVIRALCPFEQNAAE